MKYELSSKKKLIRDSNHSESSKKKIESNDSLRFQCNDDDDDDDEKNLISQFWLTEKELELDFFDEIFRKKVYNLLIEIWNTELRILKRYVWNQKPEKKGRI
ncbi:hypothetical protein DERP_010661 [Dermatophagoides pteronyssinus]|uniref:Uncharacterized protein n=1 Tax=Dermatophagoides pteronyssinus TaxID=6956 RepID=A0ABQ8JA57_DERPT|nr:hypothetical protein DERP_010661 [Dermatophagoides pteronyssinus]